MPFLAFPVGGALTSGYCFQDSIRPQDGHKRQLVFFFFLNTVKRALDWTCAGSWKGPPTNPFCQAYNSWPPRKLDIEIRPFQISKGEPGPFHLPGWERKKSI